MTYQEINQYNSPNFTAAKDVPAVFGQARVVKSITIHWWGDPATNPTFMGTVNYLCRPNGGSSCHAIAEAGKVAWIVDGTQAAWHAGNAAGNATSIGIECHPRASDGDYETIGELVRDIRAIYGDIPLVPHKSWKATQCPGVYNLARIDAIARRNPYSYQKPVQAPKPAYSAPAPAPVNNGRNPNTELNWRVESGDSLSKIALYYYGDASYAKALAEYNGISNPNAITVGQRIFIKAPLVWNIEAPDSIISIANYYGLDADALARKNGLPNKWAEIYIGNQLRIL